MCYHIELFKKKIAILANRNLEQLKMKNIIIEVELPIGFEPIQLDYKARRLPLSEGSISKIVVHYIYNKRSRIIY